MYQSKSFAMTNHLLSAICIVLGWLTGYRYIIQVQPDPGAWEAIFRSLQVGAASWVGMTIIKYTARFALNQWRKYKSKRK